MAQIRLGYEIGSGEPIDTKLTHAVATGITESGKTTVIESCMRQEIDQGKTGLVFLTKKGEEEFTEGNHIPPFFKDNPGQHQDLTAYVQELLEALTGKSLNRAEAELINVVDARSHKQIDKAETLEDVHNNLNTLLEKDMETESDVSLHGKVRSEFLKLEKYFDRVTGQLHEANLSQQLQLQEGRLNIMDLRQFDRDLQSLIIERTLQKIYRDYKNVRIAIPEVWKFAPQTSSNICKDAIVQLAREGATNNNYLILDAQDITRVDKVALKNMKQWILGLQTEKNEVERTRDQMPVSKSKAPSKDEIMSLAIGHFYYCESTQGSNSSVVKPFYAKPAWMEDIEWEDLSGDELAISIAKGETDIEGLVKAIDSGELDIGTETIEEDSSTKKDDETETIDKELEGEAAKKYRDRAENLEEKNKFLKKEIDELETELENKEKEIDNLEQRIQRLEDNVETSDEKPKDRVISAVNGGETKDKAEKNAEAMKEDAPTPVKHLEEKIEELEAEIPSRDELNNMVESIISGKNLPSKKYIDERINDIEVEGTTTRHAENVREELLQDFQEETVNHIMEIVDGFTTRQVKMLLWLEARGKSIGSKRKWYQKSLNKDRNYGSTTSEYMNELEEKGFIRVDKGGNVHPQSRILVEKKLDDAPEEKIDETYNKILAKMKEETGEK